MKTKIFNCAKGSAEMREKLKTGKKWKSALADHKKGFRLLKMIHQEDSSILPGYLLDVGLQLAEIYGSLFLSAGLIDALLLGTFREALFWAVALIGMEFVLRTGRLWMQNWFRKVTTRLWLVFYVWLRKKVFSLDYETMEQEKVIDRIASLEQTADMYGSLGVVLYWYRNMLMAALRMAASAVLVGSLCLKAPVRGKGMFGVLALPAVSFPLFGAALAGMFWASFRLSGIFAKERRQYFESNTGMEQRLEYLVEQVFMNYKAGKVVRIFGMEEMLRQNSAKETDKMLAHYDGMLWVGCRENMGNLSVSGLFTLFSYLFAAVKAATGAVTVGAFTKYAGALTQFGSACADLVLGNVKIREICTYMTEFLAFLDLESRHAAGSIPVEKRVDGEYEIAFEHVSFSYPGSKEPVLRDVNCKIDMKRKLAVVGRNGAGKTTFIKLLCRLYEPTQGRITLNGVDIRKYDEEQYRSLFSVVFQDFRLFAFPVWENVVAGQERDNTKIREALRQAGAKELVDGMPKGVDTLLYKDMGDGMEISGGEAQKLALARALYKDAPIVILDEPTAALDPLAEAEVYERFDRMVEGKTSIYISHRMSSCRFCDDILVFDKGRVAERGSHETLLAKEGLYAKLWHAQAQYYA